MPRSNIEFKLARQRKKALLERGEQTFSAMKGSISRFGFHKSRTSADDETGRISAMQTSSLSRRKAPISLPPMPWDDEK